MVFRSQVLRVLPSNSNMFSVFVAAPANGIMDTVGEVSEVENFRMLLIRRGLVAQDDWG